MSFISILECKEVEKDIKNGKITVKNISDKEMEQLEKEMEEAMNIGSGILFTDQEENITPTTRKTDSKSLFMEAKKKELKKQWKHDLLKGE